MRFAGGRAAPNISDEPGLVKTHRAPAMQAMVAHRLDQPQGPDGDDLGGIFRDVERDFDVTLRAEVIDFVGSTVSSTRRSPVPSVKSP